uniref:Uncharacterized protein n=2 Tax=Ixodes scapularis TaxID=6945 RepID=A0A1S4LUC0_IXOSC
RGGGRPERKGEDEKERERQTLTSVIKIARKEEEGRTKRRGGRRERQRVGSMTDVGATCDHRYDAAFRKLKKSAAQIGKKNWKAGASMRSFRTEKREREKWQRKMESERRR